MNGVELFCGPAWFSGIDLVIDFVSLLFLLLIAFFAYKFYKINKEKKGYLGMVWGMILLAASLLFKMITYAFIYFSGTAGISYYVSQFAPHGVVCSQTLFVGVFLLYAFLRIAGLFILYAMYQNFKSKAYYVLIAYFVIIVLLLSSGLYYVLHLTLLLLSVLIALSYYDIYKKNHLTNTKRVATSFFILALAQLIFLFAIFHSSVYIASEIVQLAGYLVLLITFILVLRYGKKTRKIRHN